VQDIAQERQASNSLEVRTEKTKKPLQKVLPFKVKPEADNLKSQERVLEPFDPMGKITAAL